MQSEPAAPMQWRLARARAYLLLSLLLRREIMHFSFPPSSPPSHASLSQSGPHLAASLSCCYYVYNARRGGTPQKRLIDGPRRRGAAEGSPPQSSSSAGPGGAPTGVRTARRGAAGRKRFRRTDRPAGCQLKRRELGDLLSFILFYELATPPPIPCPTPFFAFCPRATVRRKLAPLSTHVRHPLVKFLVPDIVPARKKTFQLSDVYAE